MSPRRTAPRRPLPSPAARVLRGMVRAYQLFVSPVMGARCRHLPTCSAYAIQALEEHGARRGAWLGFKRLLRCHPWGTSGFDPVPRRPRRTP